MVGLIINYIFYKKYKIPLLKDLIIDTSSNYKKGYIVKLKDINGNAVYGEISFLFFIQEYSLFSINKELLCIQKNAPIIIFFQKDIYKIGKHFSIQFVFQGMLLQLWFKKYQQGLFLLFSKAKKRKYIDINGIITSSKNIDLNSIKFINEGCKTLKIKVGTRKVVNDINAIRITRKALGRNFTLRCDANQKWKLYEMVEFVKAVGKYSIEYIEDPILNIYEFNIFSKIGICDIALDEKLVSKNYRKIDFKYTFAFVLKVSQIGSYKNFLTFIKKAKNRSIYIVITSTFESGLSLNILSIISSMLNKCSIGMGLSTLSFFKKDIIRPSFKYKNGKVNVAVCNSFLFGYTDYNIL